ncbi:MAG: hypothetical protein ACFCBW_13500 [Candidatus Competibacterales bacterium]
MGAKTLNLFDYPCLSCSAFYWGKTAAAPGRQVPTEPPRPRVA